MAICVSVVVILLPTFFHVQLTIAYVSLNSLSANPKMVKHTQTSCRQKLRLEDL